MTIDINELRRLIQDFKLAGSPMLVQTAQMSELLDRLEAAEKERDALRAKVETAENDAAHQKALAASALRVAEGWERKCGELRAELETERTRLAACGVVALANTPDSAKQAREMRPEYWSASCGDVARMVDENIKLRAMIQVALVVLEEVKGNINPERWPTTAVNGGWKLVPIEPTPTMITAALESSHAINAHRAEHCYRAMLAAAPEDKP